MSGVVEDDNAASSGGSKLQRLLCVPSWWPARCSLLKEARAVQASVPGTADQETVAL